MKKCKRCGEIMKLDPDDIEVMICPNCGKSCYKLGRSWQWVEDAYDHHEAFWNNFKPTIPNSSDDGAGW